jgi:hypothetical protein
MESGYDSPTATLEPARLQPLVAISRGWNSFFTHAGISLAVMLVLGVVYFVGEIIPFVNFAFSLLVAPALAAGGAHFLVRVVRGESPTFESAFDGFKRWPIATGAILLQAFVVLAVMSPVFVIMFVTIGIKVFQNPDPASIFPAMLLPVFVVGVPCYVAAIWFTSRTWPVWFVVMEPECTGAVDALRRSWAMTRGNAWRSLGLMVLVLPLEILGLIALCVGIIPAVIVWYYGLAHGYEMLRPKSAAGPVGGASAPPVFVP